MFHPLVKTSRDLPTQVLNVRGKRVITPEYWVDLLDFRCEFGLIWTEMLHLQRPGDPSMSGEGLAFYNVRP
jgi:hypothetical protein